MTDDSKSNKKQDNDPVVMDKVDVDQLADRCLQLLERSNAGDHSASNCSGFNCYKQVFVGIAGGPGSGKSYIAEQVCKTINERNSNGNIQLAECVVLPMDGYHLTRAQMKEMAEQKQEVNSDTDEDSIMTYNQLMARRGAPFTFDPASLIRDLKQCKEQGHGSFPVYDRDQHDPIPDAVQMTQENKIILVEGLYLLCLDDPNWKPLGDLWDDQWYVEVSEEETERRLVKRHLQTWDEQKTKEWGGSDEAAARRKARHNDLRNARCIAKHSRHYANFIVSNEDIPKTDDVVDNHPTYPNPNNNAPGVEVSNK